VGHDPGDQVARVTFGFAGDEGRFADRREVRWPRSGVGGAALDEDGLLDAVARPGVGVELGQAVRERAARWPEVVVGIDD
jgi:hypothetical protein